MSSSFNETFGALDSRGWINMFFEYLRLGKVAQAIKLTEGTRDKKPLVKLTDRDDLNRLPLYCCVVYNQPAAAATLLHKGDVNCRLRSGATSETALHLASRLGRLAMMRTLLSAADGAAVGTINLQDADGMTALALTVRENRPAAFRVLLHQDVEEVNVSLPNQRGWQPLHWACEAGRDEMVLALIESGAELEGRVYQPPYCLPVEIASHKGHQVCQYMVEEARRKRGAAAKKQLRSQIAVIRSPRSKPRRKKPRRRVSQAMLGVQFSPIATPASFMGGEDDILGGLLMSGGGGGSGGLQHSATAPAGLGRRGGGGGGGGGPSIDVDIDFDFAPRFERVAKMRLGGSSAALPN